MLDLKIHLVMLDRQQYQKRVRMHPLIKSVTFISILLYPTLMLWYVSISYVIMVEWFLMEIMKNQQQYVVSKEDCFHPVFTNKEAQANKNVTIIQLC